MVLYAKSRPIENNNMFKISKLTDYSLRIVAHLANTQEQLQSAAAVSAATKVTEPTVRKILKLLNDTDFLTSTQGANGGYCLVTEMQNISLLDLITAMEGGVAITDCSNNDNCCADAINCGFQSPWRYVNDKVHALLADISLAEMLAMQQNNKIKLQYYSQEQIQELVS